MAGWQLRNIHLYLSCTLMHSVYTRTTFCGSLALRNSLTYERTRKYDMGMVAMDAMTLYILAPVHIQAYK